MPQLKKVVLAMGNRLVYADTYEQALSELTGQGAAAEKTAPASKAGAPSSAPPPDVSRKLLDEISNRLRRYRELMGQGKFSEAGKEIEALERLPKN